VLSAISQFQAKPQSPAIASPETHVWRVMWSLYRSTPICLR
jgi:hypothetical protein